jgi:pilus assembly protein CpaE
MMLGSRASAGLRVALEQPDRVDSLFLDRVGISVAERVRLIAADEPWDTDPQPTEEGLSRLLGLLRQRFSHIVLDLPMPPDARCRQAIALARSVLLVMGPDVASIRDAVAMRKLSVALAGAGRTMVVLNRAGLPGQLKEKLVVEGLGGAPDAVIPDLPRQLPKAANMGRPALAASSAFANKLAPLTREISGVDIGTGSLLGRLFGRRAR